MDEHRYAKGSRFTLIYVQAGTISLCLAITYLLLLLARFFWTKPLVYTAVGLGTIFWTFNLSTICMTGVLRFNNPMGKLAALSTCPTSYDSSASYDEHYLDSDGRTYADDASLIIALWAMQIVLVILHCIYFLCFMCRKTKE